MNYEIIDFHTHPFTDAATNICSHKEYCNMSAENTVTYLKGLGISKSTVGEIIPAKPLIKFWRLQGSIIW